MAGKEKNPPEKEVIELFRKVAEKYGYRAESGQGKNNRLPLEGNVYFQFGDLRVETEKCHIIVEVESAGSVTNLAKYWYYLKKYPNALGNKRVILLHLYKQESKGDYASHLMLWEFLQEKIKREIGNKFKAVLYTYEKPTDLSKPLEMFTKYLEICKFKRKTVPTWPSFGEIIIRGNPYFRMCHGSSNTAYVDIPNVITQFLVEKLDNLSESCKNREEFYTKALEIMKDYNNLVIEDNGRELYKLNWLHFSLYHNPFMKNYCLQVRINWKAFMEFLENFSQTKIDLWKKYEYLSMCRYPSLPLVLRRDLERTQNAVKEASMDDIIGIERTLEELVNYLENLKKELMKIMNRKFWKNALGNAQTHPMVLVYLSEMLPTLKSLNSLVDNGAIPSCYIEIRKILENLAWAVFADILLLRSVMGEGEVDWKMFPYHHYISKEWYEFARNNKKLILPNIGNLKGKIKDLIKSLEMEEIKNDKKKNKALEEAIFRNLSYPSFLLISGLPIDVPPNSTSALPIYDTSSLLPGIQKDFKKAALEVNLNPEDFTEKAIKALEKTASGKIVAPYPSNDFILAFVDKTFSTKLQKKYAEYSFFVHFYPPSWEIFPFSSVLEFKILKYEVRGFSNLIIEVLNRYLEMYKKQSN